MLPNVQPLRLISVSAKVVFDGRLQPPGEERTGQEDRSRAAPVRRGLPSSSPLLWNAFSRSRLTLTPAAGMAKPAPKLK